MKSNIYNEYIKDKTYYIYTDACGNPSSFWGRIENGKVYKGTRYGSTGFLYRIEEHDYILGVYTGIVGNNGLKYRIEEDRFGTGKIYIYHKESGRHLAYVYRPKNECMYSDDLGNNSFVFRLKKS